MENLFEKLSMVEAIETLSVNDETKNSMMEALTKNDVVVCHSVDELMKSLNED